MASASATTPAAAAMAAAAGTAAGATPLAAAVAAASKADNDGGQNAATSAAGVIGTVVGGAGVSASEVVPRVLSVQSSVVYGYVGNKSATFPLQVLGFDVDPINTCQFSNHTGYPKFRGAKATAQDVTLCIEGLALNALLQRYTHVLSGYMAATPLVQALPPVIQQLRQANPKIVYVCDPVLGDNGALYVPAEFVPLYRDALLPLADVVTPNQTEAEVLSGMTIRSVADALRVCAWFHGTYPRIHTVIIKSAKLAPTADPALSAGAKGTDDANTIHCIATTVLPLQPTTASAASAASAAGAAGAAGAAAAADAKVPATASGAAGRVPTHFYHVPIPVVSGYFSGTGDLCSALLLAWMHSLHNALPDAIERTMNTVHAVLRRTAGSGHSDKELLLVQSKRDIENPPVAAPNALRAVRYAIPADLIKPVAPTLVAAGASAAASAGAK